MTADTHAAAGREAFERAAWADAYALLTAADAPAQLGGEDLERLAVAAALTGRDEPSAAAWARAHQDWLRHGEAARAVRCAFWLAYGLMDREEMAQASGWFARAQRLLDESGLDCVERGYLLLPDAIGAVEGGGDVDAARELFERASETAQRFRDPDLMMFARLGRGRALIRSGQTRQGIALLDEIMISITAGDVSPVLAGSMYCLVIVTCREIFDLRRAQEWTEALTRWCEAQPDLVPFRGRCLVHRAEIMQLHGDWVDALGEAQHACEQLTAGERPAMGDAHYVIAELHRLRGEHREAEGAFQRANEAGRPPQPGLALLRLAQGNLTAAQAAIRRAAGETNDVAGRGRLLPAAVEIALAAGDHDAAQRAAAELASIAEMLDAEHARAVADDAGGATLLAAGDAQAALGPLRRAWSTWQALDAPYQSARSRVLIGLACRAMGDEDSAGMELRAARTVFIRLGAAPDAARVDDLAGAPVTSLSGGLTGREVEVLRLLAEGKTNRAIATTLFISEKTVARHVSNIYTKLGNTSRAAATAHAYKHRIV